MFRRVSRLAATVTLFIPASLCAYHYRPANCPPPTVVVCPPTYYHTVPAVPQFSPIPDCPPAAPAQRKDHPQTPPSQMPPPSVKEKEKSEIPQPKAVTPAAAVEAPKKDDLAIPSPAVPETPTEKPKPRIEEVVPSIPPAPSPLPKFDLPLAQPEAAKPEVAPKTLVLPPLKFEPAKKAEELKLPELVLPPITRESKYGSETVQPNVKVIPVEGPSLSNSRIVRFFNYTESAWTLSANGKSSVLPAKSSLSFEISTDTMAWKLNDRVRTTNLPTDSVGLQIVLQ